MPNTKRKCIDRPPPQFNSPRKRPAKSVFDRLGDKKGYFHNGSTLVVSIPFDRLESHHLIHINDGVHGRKGNSHSGNISGSTFDRPEHHHIHYDGHQAAKEMEFRHQRDLHGGVKHIRTNSGSIRGKGWRSKKWPTFTKSNFK